MMKHGGTVRLETERLILRRFTVHDAGAMYRNWASDPEVTTYMTWPPHPSVDVTRQLLTLWVSDYEKPDSYQWAIELRSLGEPVGSISVVRQNGDIDEMELGWCVGSRWWGRGIMPEAARAVMKYLFESVGVNRLAARHAVDNPKSGRVMQKLGMTREGVLRQAGRSNQGIEDMVQYSILASEYPPPNT